LFSRIIRKDGHNGKLGKPRPGNSASGAISVWVRLPLVSHTTDTVFYLFSKRYSILRKAPAVLYDTKPKGVDSLISP
jgi:hypothetical protein